MAMLAARSSLHVEGSDDMHVLRAQYFRQDSPVAARFVDWFRRLFEGGGG